MHSPNPDSFDRCWGWTNSSNRITEPETDNNLLEVDLSYWLEMTHHLSPVRAEKVASMRNLLDNGQYDMVVALASALQAVCRELQTMDHHLN